MDWDKKTSATWPEIEERYGTAAVAKADGWESNKQGNMWYR